MFAPNPEEHANDFGVVLDSPLARSGYVKTADVPALVADCGCTDDRGHALKVQSLPFSGTAKVGGKVWILRVEPLGSFDVGGSFENRHHWSFAAMAGPADTDR